MTLDIGQVNLELNDLIRKHFKGKFDEIRSLETPYGQLGELTYHIFDDVNFWIDNLTGVSVQLKSYQDLATEEEFFNEWLKVDNRLLDYFKKNKFTIDYSKKILMKFGSGKEWWITTEDLLMHMSHHAFYHRGALGAVVRLNKLDPLPTSNWLGVVIDKIKAGDYDK